MAINTHQTLTVVENVRMAISFSDQTPPDTLRLYATEYASLCQTLQQRFEQILPFLKRDNVAEAVRHAEMAPNLVDFYTTLDFDGREHWLEICDALDLPLPPPLPYALFLQLQDAYTILQPLESLLQQNRLLALNGSPPRDRLMVIRELAQRDIQNTYWATDQEQFEKIRIAQLKTEIPKVIAAKNDFLVRLLYQELTAPGWRVEPPPQFLETVVEAILMTHAQPFLQQANSFDVAGALQSHDAMQQILHKNRMEMPQSVANYIAPAVQWLTMEQQNQESSASYRQAELELATALENEASKQELENLFYSLRHLAGQAGRTISPQLEQHYSDRIQDLTTKATRRSRAILAAILLPCLFFLLLIGAGIVLKIRDQNVAQVLETLLLIEKENRVADIEKTLSQFQSARPGILKMPEVAAVVARLQSLHEENAQRAQNLERYLLQVEAAINSQPTSLTEFRALAQTLQQIDALTLTAAEKQWRDRVYQQFLLLQSQKQRKIDETFGQALALLNTRQQAILHDARNEESLEILSSLEENVQELLQKSPDISEPIRREGEALQKRISEQHAVLSQSLTENAAFQQLLHRTATLPQHKAAFSAFVSRFPKHYAASDLTAAVEASDAIQEVDSILQTLCRAYNDSHGDYEKLQAATPVVLANCVELATKINGRVDEFFAPFKELSRFDGKTPFDKTTFGETKDLLTLIARKELYPYITSDGEWYYCTTLPTNRDRLPKYVTSFAATGTELPEEIPYAELKQFDKWRSGQSPASHQRDWATESLRQIAKIESTSDSRIREICNFLDRIVAQEYLDPILRVVMLNRVIDDYAKSDPVFAESFADVENQIVKSQVDMETNWLDVESTTTLLEREKSRVLLEQLPPFGEQSERIQQEIDLLAQRLGHFSPKFQFVGILYKEGQDWVKPPVPSDVTDGILIALTVSGEKVSSTIVGNISGGTVTMTAISPRLRPFCPVFVKH